MRKLTISKSNIYLIFVFLLIYCSHDTLLFGTNANSIWLSLRNILPFVFLGVILLCEMKYKKKYNAKIFGTCLLFSILPFFSCIINREAYNNYIYRFIIMIVALLLAFSEESDKVLSYYNKIIYFLCIWSVIAFLVQIIAPSFFLFFPKVTNSSGIVFYSTFFSNNTMRESYGVRNYGIFREPGIFVVFLTTAILLELITGEKKTKTKKLIVFSIGMLTTLSSAGYIILGIIYISIIIMNKEIKHKGSLIILIIVSLLILLTRTTLLSINGGLLSKFIEGTNSYGSWFARQSSLIENMRIALEHPIAGIGRYSLYNTVLTKSGVYMAIDNTNTITIAYAAYGFIFGTFILFGCWVFWEKTNKRALNIVIFLIFFAALSNEDMGQNYLFYFFVFKGIIDKFSIKKIQCDGEEANDTTYTGGI